MGKLYGKELRFRSVLPEREREELKWKEAAAFGWKIMRVA